MPSIEERNARAAAKREARRARSKFADDPTWGEVDRNRRMGRQIDMRMNEEKYLHGFPVTSEGQMRLKYLTRRGKRIE